MRGFAIAVICLISVCCIAQERFALDGTWSFHTWSGYQPAPQKTVADGVLSVRNVEGQYGFALQSSVKPNAKAGDTVTFTAKVRGKGRLGFKLHNLDAQAKWIAVANQDAGERLSDEWHDVSLKVSVDNMGTKMTERVLVTVGAGKGAELDIKEAELLVEHTEYVGDAFFPLHWDVFADVPNAEEPPLDRIPSEIAGVRAKTVKMENNKIDFATMFKTPKLRNCAWLFSKIVANAPGEYTIGGGADYFMALYVNGESVIDTLKSGDGADIPHFTNHIGKAMLRKGENIVAVKFESGTAANPFISLAGAGDLRNLSDIINVTERSFFDDYESKRERSGNPELVKRIFTEGMDNLTTQAIYREGAVISGDVARFELPAKSGGKLFSTGLRLYEFNGDGALEFRIGGETRLSVAHAAAGGLRAVLSHGGRTLKSMSVPLSMLPADIIIAIGHNSYAVNAMSIQSSRLVGMSGAADFSELHAFGTSVAVKTASVRVDDYFTGLAMPERNDNSIPYNIDMAAEFDPVKAGWKMIFNDEFDGDAFDWKNNWTTSPWTSENDKNKEMVTVKDGMARFSCEWYNDDKGNPRGRTISAYSRRRFGYGYYEARVRFTRKPGCWAAFWMHDEGRNLQLGGGYEIDIFEDYPTRGGKPVVASNLHTTRGKQSNSYGYHFDLPKTLDDFYVIGCKWTPFEISTYIDGRLVKSVSRHSPWQSVTYDAFYHGFCTNKNYICIGLCSGTTGGKGVVGDREEFHVDWIRGYEYPMELCPKVAWKELPVKSSFATGEGFILSAESSAPGVAFLFDNGYLIDYKRKPPYTFTLAIDEKHYMDTAWARAGRSGQKMALDRYPHIYRIAVQDSDGRVGFTDVFPVIADMRFGEPYNGVAQTVPGRVNPAAFNTGGHNVSCYKQDSKNIPDGKECFSRSRLNLREAGEYVSIAVDVKEGRAYKLTMPRRPYPEDLRWPVRALLFVDGVYVGDLVAPSYEKNAVLEKVRLSKGLHNVTLMSACSYGVWPEALVFE